MASTKVGNNYTLLLRVRAFEARTATAIINERTTVTVNVLESKPVIKIVPAADPFIHRRSSLGPKCDQDDPRLCPYSQIVHEPFEIDASYSYDPDGVGLCFRWECVEPASCTSATNIGTRVWQGAGKDKVSFGLYAVRFLDGISDVDICQLHKHPSGLLKGQAFGQNGPMIGNIDPVECARLLEVTS